jgi:metacaspase-1
MPTGISIHIGLDTLSNHYSEGVFDSLNSGIKDARDFYFLAKKQNFTPTLWVNDPKVKEVKLAITKAAEILNLNNEGGMLLITFSGHGNQVPDKIPQIPDYKPDEENGKPDQTWCLFDRQLIDDELAQLWTLFNANVRILVISDSCHSGTVLTLNDFNHNTFAAVESGKNYIKNVATKNMPNTYNNMQIVNKFGKNLGIMSPNVFLDNVFTNHFSDTYKEVIIFLMDDLKRQKSLPGNENVKNFKDLIKASVISISSCMDNQRAKDGDVPNSNSIFVAALKKVWNHPEAPNIGENGFFRGDYTSFHRAIYEATKNNVNPIQNPNIISINAEEFLKMQPFQI